MRLIRDWPETIVDSLQIDPKTGGARSLRGVTANAPGVNRIAKESGAISKKTALRIISSHEVME
jgi:hypothetical protein